MCTVVSGPAAFVAGRREQKRTQGYFLRISFIACRSVGVLCISFRDKSFKRWPRPVCSLLETFAVGFSV